ncbi:hypothetical protein T265_01737 [Opisthorchis viverrini]|uniref:Uncharacterized protein n=1 Tax=Opisthorchis viverrini TaxID=6198 RepID=A0A075A8S0_OPIVI|nr:hypothetical protein T265_01737 [Opisthorchis viverrini]KER32115.1 hypothetical protein T265_01737 [Opisthorchis viverrini]
MFKIMTRKSFKEPHQTEFAKTFPTTLILKVFDLTQCEFIECKMCPVIYGDRLESLPQSTAKVSGKLQQQRPKFFEPISSATANLNPVHCQFYATPKNDKRLGRRNLSMRYSCPSKRHKK